MVLGAVGLAAAFAASENKVLRGAVISLMAIITYLMLDQVAEYVGMNDGVSVESVTAYVDKRQALTVGNTAVDLNNKGFLERAFLFLFTPLFDGPASPLRLLVSLENLLLLLVTGYCLPTLLKVVFRSRHPAVLYSMSFLFTGTIILSATVPNQGLAIRQKMMLIPPLYTLLALALWVKSQQREECGIGEPQVQK